MVESERLLFLELHVAVAFGTQVLRRWASKEAAVVDAQLWSLAPMLFRHLDLGFCFDFDFCNNRKKKNYLIFWGKYPIPVNFPVDQRDP